MPPASRAQTRSIRSSSGWAYHASIFAAGGVSAMRSGQVAPSRERETQWRRASGMSPVRDSCTTARTGPSTSAASGVELAFGLAAASSAPSVAGSPTRSSGPARSASSSR